MKRCQRNIARTHSTVDVFEQHPIGRPDNQPQTNHSILRQKNIYIFLFFFDSERRHLLLHAILDDEFMPEIPLVNPPNVTAWSMNSLGLGSFGSSLFFRNAFTQLPLVIDFSVQLSIITSSFIHYFSGSLRFVGRFRNLKRAKTKIEKEN